MPLRNGHLAFCISSEQNFINCRPSEIAASPTHFRKELLNFQYKTSHFPQKNDPIINKWIQGTGADPERRK